ncbi:MAG: hypothetical protein LBC63_00825, partial [Holophagales bacterium]|nr:hypothetical protein [Holophagales bacterium]
MEELTHEVIETTRILQYKGYDAIVKRRYGQCHLYVEVQNTLGPITFQSESIEKVVAALKAILDVYIEQSELDPTLSAAIETHRNKMAKETDIPHLLETGQEQRIKTSELLLYVLSIKDMNNEMSDTLNEIDGLSGLFRTQPQMLKTLRPLQEEHAPKILAIRELIKRSMERVTPIRLQNPRTIAEYLKPKLFGARVESLGIIGVNDNLETIGDRIVATGGQTEISVSVQEILKHAMDMGARGIVAFHNHTGASTCPSEEDIHLTEKLFRKGEA